MSRLLSVSVPDELLAQAEAVAEDRGQSKSEFVREALRAHVDLQRLRMLQLDARSAAERLGIGPEDVEELVDDVRSGSR